LSNKFNHIDYMPGLTDDDKKKLKKF